jgi:FkbM family methyltransferase
MGSAFGRKIQVIIDRVRAKERPDLSKGRRYAYLGDYRGLINLHNGLWMVVDTRDISLAPSLIAFGCWEPQIEPVVTRLARPGSVVVDLGANFGYYTLALGLATGPHGKVYSIEANPHLSSLLCDSVAINGFGDRVSLRNVAILDRRATVDLLVDPKYFGGGHLAEGEDKTDLLRYSVEGMTLCDALPGVDRIDVLRMDVEGSEPLVLRGAEALIRNSPNLVIISEWDLLMMTPRCDVPAFIKWLSDLGFHYWLIRMDSTLQPLTPKELTSLPHSDVVITRSLPSI